LVGVALTGCDRFDPDMPDVTGLEEGGVKFNGQRRRFVFRPVKKKKKDARSITAEKIKLYPVITKMDPKGERASREDLTSLVQNHLFLGQIGLQILIRSRELCDYFSTRSTRSLIVATSFSRSSLRNSCRKRRSASVFRSCLIMLVSFSLVISPVICTQKGLPLFCIGQH
jgi:hypothetical protein